MKRFAKYLLVALSAVSCRRSVAPSASQPVAYEDSVYCFNQRSIVSAGGLYGMVDKEGNRILPLGYQSLEFLSDEVALGCLDGRWQLLTRDGEIIREGPDRSLSDAYAQAYESWLQRRENFWNVALDKYEDLCNTCIALRLSGHPRSAEVSEAVSRLEWLRHYLQGADASMPPAQAERFRELSLRYNRYVR